MAEPAQLNPLPPGGGRIANVNPSTALATVLIDELIRGGVREVVLCPGSRSAPLAYAVRAAERAGRLRLHVRVDERSAGFLAVGLSKGSAGTPVPVITTSGTAVANLHPAVLEAHHAGVALVVLSADRPHELRGSGANQTTDQPGIFGPALRFQCDFPASAAEATAADSRWWRSTVSRAVAAATGQITGATPGPVMLNVAFREPLLPAPSDAPDLTGAADLPEPLRGRPTDRPWTQVAPMFPGAASPLSHRPRTVVVIGSLPQPGDTATAMAWAAGRGYPVIAEPFGASGPADAALPGGPLVLSAHGWVDEHLPERVVVVGRVTLSRPVGDLLRRPGMLVEVVAAQGPWADPSAVAATVHPFAALVVERSDDHAWQGTAADRAWSQAWRDAGQVAASVIASTPADSGVGVARALTGALPAGATLVVGPSNPVRDLDFAFDRATTGDLIVQANRGLAGIDGVVSTAIGVALSDPARPAYAYIGDLTFAHDSGALLIGPAEPRPDLTIVVVNDDGGGIFTTLEPGSADYATDFERLFGTPTGTDLAALCAAHGVRHDLVQGADGLAAEVAKRPAGLRVVEVRVDRGTHRAAHHDLRERFAEQVRAQR